MLKYRTCESCGEMAWMDETNVCEACRDAIDAEFGDDEDRFGECEMCGELAWLDDRYLCDKCQFVWDADFVENGEDIRAVFVSDEKHDFDALVFQNGKWIGIGSKEEFEMFLEAEGDDFSDWDGIPWTEIDFVPDIQVIARHLGEPLAYYDKSGRLHILNEEKWERRKTYWLQEWPD